VDRDTPTFASDDEEAAWCLSLLREGDRGQKIVGRERLAYIFERRGLLDAAVECLESNVRDGVRDPRAYQRLAGIYRRQGNDDLADEALDEARLLEERRGQERPALPRIDDLADHDSDEDGPEHPLEAATRPLPAAGPRAPAAIVGRSARDFESEPIPARARPWYAAPAVVTAAILLCGPFGIALLWLQTAYASRTKWTVTGAWLALSALAGVAAWSVVQSNIDPILAASRPAATAPSASGPVVAPSPLGLPFGSPSPVASPAGVTIGPGVSPSPVAGVGASPVTSPAGAPGGTRVRVAGGATQGANLRERSSASAPVVKVVAPGAVLEVVGADQQAEGRAWRNVRDGTGATGWVAAELLEPAS